MAVFALTMNSASAPALSGTAGSLIAVLDYCLVTTMGWTKPFTGTNLASYKQPVGTNGMYLAVDDTGSTDARATGYEVMTTVTAGTGPFPTPVQQSGGGFIYKSAVANATVRPWAFFSDGKIFHLLISYDSAATGFNLTNNYSSFTFGDFKSFKSGDVFNTMVATNTSAQAASALSVSSNTYASPTSGFYAARSHTQVGGSVALSRFSDSAALGGSQPGNGTNAFPNPIDGGMLFGRSFVGELGVGRRGSIPGLWVHGHPYNSLQSADTIAGATDLAGRNFSYWRLDTSSSAIFETTNTWAT